MSTADATDLHDFDRRELAERVAPILDGIRRRGDEAIRSAAHGGIDADHATLRLSDREIERCVAALPALVVDDLRLAQDRMRIFAEAQRAAITDFEAETLPGIHCGVRHAPVESAGVCLPVDGDGFSIAAVQAGVIAAHAAGVGRVVACVPTDAGRPPGLLVGALALAGVREMYLASGVRALAALTFGTESIPRVELAFGASDAAMDEARRQLAELSPSRLRRGLLIIADDCADPELVAADLISGHADRPGGRAVMLTTSPALAALVPGAIERQLDMLPHSDEAMRSWERHGTIRLVTEPEAACTLADRYGLECVEVMAANPRWYLERLHRCRHVFLGEAAGMALVDGVAEQGTGLIRGEQGSSVRSFLRAITYRAGHSDDEGGIARLRRLGGLESYARACELRAGRGLLHTAPFAALAGR